MLISKSERIVEGSDGILVGFFRYRITVALRCVLVLFDFYYAEAYAPRPSDAYVVDVV